MHPQFSLENPDTFNAVFPWTHIEASKQSSTEGGAHSSKLLQEKASAILKSYLFFRNYWICQNIIA